MIIVIFLFILAPAVQICLFLQAQSGLDLFGTFNYASSIFAVHGIMGNIFLASKIPILQNIVPYDKRVRIHIMVTIPILFTLVYHTLYKIFLNYNADIIIWLLGIIFIIMLISSIKWIPVPGFKKFRLMIHSKIEAYDASKSLHSLFQILIGFMIIFHTMKAGIITDSGIASTILYILLYTISMSSLLLSKSRLFKIEAKVTYVERRNELIIFHISPEKAFRYKAGQFIFLGYRDSNGRKEYHPFSILSRPGELLNGQFSLAIKKLGDFTTQLQKIEIGDSVNISGAFGNFHPKEEKSICFIGSGIGVVPLISNIKELAKEESNRKIYAILSVRYREDIPELSKLNQLVDSRDNIKIIYLISSEIRVRYSKELFQDFIAEIESTTFYLCASNNMLKTIKKILAELKVPSKAIHNESFSF